MTLQTSGLITLQDIANEFGGTHPLSLQDYYRGGSFVALSVVASASAFQTAPLTPATGVAIPTSGLIQMSHFYGTTYVSPSALPIDGYSIQSGEGNNPSGGTNTYVTLAVTGAVQHGGGGSLVGNNYIGPANWLIGGIYSDYQVIVDTLDINGGGGSVHGPAVGTWTSLPVTFQGGCSGHSAIEGFFNCRIRQISTSAIVATFTVDISLDNT